MVVPPKHPKMSIFSRKTPWLLGTTILGNPYMCDVFKMTSTRIVCSRTLFCQVCHGQRDFTGSCNYLAICLSRLEIGNPVNGFTCSEQSRHCQNAQLPCRFCFGAKEGTWMQLPTYWAFHSSPRCCQRTSLIPMPQGEGQQGGTWFSEVEKAGWELFCLDDSYAMEVRMHYPSTPTTWATMQCKRTAAECPSATWLRGMTSTGDFLEDSPYKPSNSNMIHQYIQHNQKSQCRDTWEGEGTQHQFEFKVFMDSHLWSLQE